ncbi:MAG: ParA family protein [Acidobacteriota bacterium]
MRYVVFNRKGGVGKSTITCNLAAVAAEAGRRTLVVDLDPQANATHYLLGPRAPDCTPTVYNFFEQTLGFRLLSAPADTWVHPTPFPRLHVMPSDPQLGDLQPKLESRHKIYKLRDQLRALEDRFDVVFIDTPPAVNIFTTSALIAAHRVLIPFDCDDFSRRALYQLMGTAREIHDDHNPELAIGGVVVNLFQPRARLPQQLVEELKAEGLPLLEPYIHTSVKVRESHQAHAPLIHHAPKHKLAQQYRDLYARLDDGPASPPPRPGA